jgi:hypothetical protein
MACWKTRKQIQVAFPKKSVKGTLDVNLWALFTVCSYKKVSLKFCLLKYPRGIFDSQICSALTMQAALWLRRRIPE